MITGRRSLLLRFMFNILEYIIYSCHVSILLLGTAAGTVSRSVSSHDRMLSVQLLEPASTYPCYLNNVHLSTDPVASLGQA